MNEEKLYTINVINEFDLNEIKAIAFGCNDSEEITVVYKDDVRFDLIPYKDIKAINFVGKHLVIEKNETKNISDFIRYTISMKNVKDIEMTNDFKIKWKNLDSLTFPRDMIHKMQMDGDNLIIDLLGSLS